MSTFHMEQHRSHYTLVLTLKGQYPKKKKNAKIYNNVSAYNFKLLISLKSDVDDLYNDKNHSSNQFLRTVSLS